jgi:hypothetical protein
MFRLTAIGDIGRIGVEAADRIVSEIWTAGLAIVGYTHHWREPSVADAWKGRLMASADTVQDADRAVSEGWRASVVLPIDAPRVSHTPDGHKIVVCPAILAPKKVTCNTCRLCDASKPGPVIGFPAHGNVAKE